MSPGIHDGIPAGTYHADPNSISKTGLARYADNPARYRHGDPQQTRPMALGELAHAAILEPASLSQRYHVSRLKIFSEDHKAFREDMVRAMGRKIVKQAEWDEAMRMRDSIMRHPVARELLTADLIVERTAVWHDPDTGVRLRARPDGIAPVANVIVDLKSARDASPRAFAKVAAEYRYHWQPPIYGDGMRLADGWHAAAFIFLAVEPEQPHLAAAYELSPRALAQGRLDVQRTLRAYARDLARDTWPGHSPEIETLDLPSYIYDPSPSLRGDRT
ncbi:MAG TPA: PD-(D/E)XK nuclease-like domain-containing protein [Acetobacteraceae bacterium]